MVAKSFTQLSCTTVSSTCIICAAVAADTACTASPWSGSVTAPSAEVQLVTMLGGIRRPPLAMVW